MKRLHQKAVLAAMASAAVLGVSSFKLVALANDSNTTSSMVARGSSSNPVSDNLARKLQAALDKTVQKNKLPGATAGIISPQGKWFGVSGFSNLETKRAMSLNNLFLIGSTTKAFTGATLLKLQEKGKLSLDDTLGKWLPTIVAKAPDWQNLTIRQLLNGSSGVYDYTNQWDKEIVNDPSILLSKQWTPEKLVAFVYDKPRFTGESCVKGKNWCYPNTGNILAGMIVEKATGSDYASVLRRQILQPLKLNHTFVAGQEEIPAGLVRSYRDYNADGTPEDITKYDLAYIIPSVATGAMISNAQDLARFNQALFGGKLLKPNSLKQMLTGVDAGQGYRYGLGVNSFDTPFGRQWGKGGDSLGNATLMSYLPKSGVTVVVSANQQPSEDNFSPQEVLSNAVLKTFLKGGDRRPQVQWR